MANEEKPADPEPNPEDSSPSDDSSKSDAGSDAGSKSDSDDSSAAENQSDGGSDYYDEDDESPETTIKMFNSAMDAEFFKKAVEREDKGYIPHEDKFNFPPDPENWREEDLKELWADGPIGITKPGWDPSWVDEEDVEVLKDEIMEGNDPPIAPFYLPYRKPYPVIPNNHHDISNPKSVIEELDRIEEFLQWVSFIFHDGSS